MKNAIPLVDLEVLVLDCQATGPGPANGSLLEFGWTRARACDAFDTSSLAVQSYLCPLPEGDEIPRRVTRVTGLKTEDLTGSPSLPVTWEKLKTAALQVAAANRSELCPTVIHYARFEEPFLHQLHQQHEAGGIFPFDIICTHQVIRRLVPRLPRKGLRAIAGYFGHSVPEQRRSPHHVEATVFIWRQAARLLAEQDIVTLEKLKEWLAQPVNPASRPGMHYPMERSIRAKLPDRPGIYRMLRSNGDLLYIGKAASLKKRVNSYFYSKKPKGRGEHILEMLSQAVDLDVTVTGSALEAALMETDEIKEHSPPYNVALRRRDREIAFFSPDLRDHCPTADEGHPVGPLPSGISLTPFAAVDALLKGELAHMEETGVCLLTLGVYPEYAPGIDCFREGVEIFNQRHGQFLAEFKDDRYARKLQALGKLLRQKRLEEKNLEKPGEEEEAEVEKTEWVWTPGAVAGTLEGVIRHGAHLLRRSRWYLLLSESALAWQTGGAAGGRRRLLILQGGRVTWREDIPGDQAVPVPPGYDKSFADRRKCFDVMTYDRLRVLTTELRRLAADETGRNLQLCLRAGIVLNDEQLRKLFQWV
jgi:DNA polymerase-3 subunit epsilon